MAKIQVWREGVNGTILCTLAYDLTAYIPRGGNWRRYALADLVNEAVEQARERAQLAEAGLSAEDEAAVRHEFEQRPDYREAHQLKVAEPMDDEFRCPASPAS